MWLALTLLSGNAAAHDLALDRLSLFPDQASQTLRGQLTLDPELTRELDEPPTPTHALALLALARTELKIYGDRVALPIGFEVRELWTRNGAVSGDLVMLTCALPATVRSLRVEVGNSIPALAVSVQPKEAGGVADTHSVLVLGGHSSPPYVLGGRSFPAGLVESWLEGGPEQFAEPLDSKRQPSSAGPASQVASGAPTVSLALSPSSSALDLTRVAPEQTAGASEDRSSTATRGFLGWVCLGFSRVLPHGLDHALFVLALTLSAWGSAPNRRTRLVWVLSAFALTQPVALAACVIGLWTLPRGFLEVVIAASIAYVGLRSVRAPAAPPGSLLAVAFGLIHGQGVAFALLDADIPRRVATPLISCSLGVPLAQMCAASLFALALCRTPPPHLDRVRQVTGWCIGLAGAVWTVERALRVV